MPPIKMRVWTLGKISDDIRWMKFWENGIQGKWPEHFIMKVKKHTAEKPLFSLTFHRRNKDAEASYIFRGPSSS